MRLFGPLLLLVLLASLAPLVLLALLLSAQGVAVGGAALLAGAAALLLALGVSFGLARHLTRPLVALVQGSLDIARGRFGRQVTVTGRSELADMAYAFNHMSRELERYDGENARLLVATERGYLDTIRALASAIDAKDPYTRGHSERVAALGIAIGRELNLDEATLRVLEFAGVLHDVGKIGVPEQVLRKPGRLTPEEMTLIRSHAVVGGEIVEGVEFLRAAEPAIRHHHERWDGGGYPDGLIGEAIPLVARIINAADTWDACTSDRPYQRARSEAEVIAILDGLRGTQVDPVVHDAIFRVVTRRTSTRERTA